MAQPAGPVPRPMHGSTQHGSTWESFAATALRRLVGLLSLLVIVLGVLTWSWEVALTTARLALVVLFVLSTWLYIIWFAGQRAALSRRDEATQDQVQDFRLS